MALASEWTTTTSQDIDGAAFDKSARIACWMLLPDDDDDCGEYLQLDWKGGERPAENVPLYVIFPQTGNC